ncbi:hypothetical protein B0H11DRAFT_1961344 [Mycena galericulata]|nr:hypothetical protein B0H11DRAFT_1981042 [Mycena galericulata]KAJ7509869.1 hypothetical protein B0H11DRAFT_1961344 [Mycena galericulata]
MLDLIPPELCAHIFGFACCDTGFTGRSLSLVSKYIRETSKPARLQSIALFGRKQILAFAELLNQTPAHLRTTRYLFVNGQESEAEMEKIFDVAYGGWRRAQAERRKLRPEIEPESVREWEEELIRQQFETYQYLDNFGREAATALESILRNLAQTLELLDLALNQYVAKMMLNTLSLPRLADLTTRCCFPLHPDATPVLEPSHSLRRLHVVEVDEQWASTSRFFENGISHFAPSLTHLRLSQLGQDDSIIDDLEKALGLAQFPPTLEQVLLKPAVAPPPHEGCSCCDDTVVYYDLLRSARQLRDKHDYRVTLLEADGALLVDDPYLQEWLDKADGAPCCWDTSRIDRMNSD